MASARGLMTDERRAMGAGTTCCLRPRKYLSNPTFVGVRSSGDYPPRASQALHVLLGGRSGPRTKTEMHSTSRPLDDASHTARGRRASRGRRELSSPKGDHGLHHIFWCNHHTHLRRSTLAEAPAEVPRPLNDLGALAERPLSTCTLVGDQRKRGSALLACGGRPNPPSHMAGCSGAANDRMVSLRAAAEAIVGCRSW